MYKKLHYKCRTAIFETRKNVKMLIKKIDGVVNSVEKLTEADDLFDNCPFYQLQILKNSKNFNYVYMFLVSIFSFFRFSF